MEDGSSVERGNSCEYEVLAGAKEAARQMPAMKPHLVCNPLLVAVMPHSNYPIYFRDVPSSDR